MPFKRVQEFSKFEVLSLRNEGYDGDKSLTLVCLKESLYIFHLPLNQFCYQTRNI